MPPIRPVVLSGGSGTRLWPLSTPDVPKQFRPLFGNRSLFGLTLERLVGMTGLEPAIVVTGKRHWNLVSAEIETAAVETGMILVEPVARNTAPAVFAAALVADQEDVLVILPSDHLVRDAGGFQDALAVAAELADRGGIVTFGVRPTRPETGFGYIELGAATETAHHVASFREKPGEAEATDLVADGRHLWNSGIFVARADRLVGEAEQLCPKILDGVRAALPETAERVIRLSDGFGSVEAISFDYAVMERTEHAMVIPLDVGWSDVGSYRSLLDASDQDGAGNHISGDVTVADVTGSYINATSRSVVVAGLDDVVVVETPEAVLVLPIERAQDVKDLQARDAGK